MERREIGDREISKPDQLSHTIDKVPPNHDETLPNLLVAITSSASVSPMDSAKIGIGGFGGLRDPRQLQSGSSHGAPSQPEPEPSGEAPAAGPVRPETTMTGNHRRSHLFNLQMEGFDTNNAIPPMASDQGRDRIAPGSALSANPLTLCPAHRPFSSIQYAPGRLSLALPGIRPIVSDLGSDNTHNMEPPATGSTYGSRVRHGLGFNEDRR